VDAKAAQWVVEVEGAPKAPPAVEEDPWAAQAASVLPPAEPKEAPLVGARKPGGILPAVEPTPDEARRSYLSVHYSKDNRTAEEFRALKNALLAHGQNPRVIAVASCGAGEGKTALAVNLATSFADTYGEKVVLVDGNIRRPKLAEVLGLNGDGLNEVVRGHAKAEDVVAKTNIPGLWALGAGTEAERTEGLHDSRSVGELLKWLRKRYSRVIVELPALCDAPEALALARQADVVLISVLRKRTRRAGLIRMLESFKGLDREKVRCVFVNA
jgi:Mrp family chromosome partitioning ATPase